ncbi:hypothetical protein BDV3_001081 [Batrachochytrium dendrobatidis]
MHIFSIKTHSARASSDQNSLFYLTRSWACVNKRQFRLFLRLSSAFLLALLTYLASVKHLFFDRTLLDTKPTWNITSIQINTLISKLENINAQGYIPEMTDIYGVGNLARDYKEAYGIYHQLLAHNYESDTVLRVEKEFFAFEARLFPWVIKGKKYRSAIDMLLNTTGRGIAITTGSKYALVAKLVVTMLHEIGSTLPIEIFYCGKDDLGTNELEMFSAFPNVKLADMQDILGIDQCSRGYENKPFAVLASSFREVIMIDADVLFFQPPEVIFESAGYKEMGAVIFRDRTLEYGTWNHGPSLKRLVEEIAHPYLSNLIYPEARVMRKKTAQEIDAGVVVWDKMRTMPAILLTCLLNSSPYKHWIYDRTLGDKETFWLSHEALHLPLYVPKDNGGSIGRLTESRGTYAVCGKLYHQDEEGKPLWFNGGVGLRVPSKDLKMVQLTHWATESSADNVYWDLTTEPFCLIAKLDAPSGYTDPHIGSLDPAEVALTQKMSDLWKEYFQL